MYTPVPDVEDRRPPLTSTTIAAPDDDKTTPQVWRTCAQRRAMTVLTAAVWISGLCFGTFAAGHYIRRAATGQWELWDLSDRGLYRPDQSCWANRLMVTHMAGGVVLMTVGPWQPVPWVRRQYLNVHRNVGRLYIWAALVTSVSVTTFVLFFRTSRKDIWEDMGNVLLGILMMTCAVHSYRNVRKGNIEQHKWWSYRLYALVWAAVWYRLVIVVYFAFVLFTPWHGSRWIFESIFFAFFLPNLGVVQLYKQNPPITKYRHNDDDNAGSTNPPPPSWLATHLLYQPSLLVACTVGVTILTGLNIVYDWGPSLLGRDEGQGANLDKAYDHALQRLSV